MKKLQESIREYEEAKLKDENMFQEALENEEKVVRERAEKHLEFLSKDQKKDEEKVRLGNEILERVTVFTEDEWFMKGLVIASSPSKTRKIYETPVRTVGEYLDEIRERLGHFKRHVTHVFACNSKKDLVYYQYWTPTQWAEGMSCAHSKRNISDKIPLRTQEDFKKIPYDAVSTFHKALHGDNVVDQLIERIRHQTARGR